MRTVSHHPSHDLLAAYAAGSLSLSQALCVSTHIEHCSTCRQTLQRLNCLGSALMQKLDPSPVSATLKSRVLVQLDRLPEAALKKNRAADPSIPNSLRQWVDGDYEGLRWKRLSPAIYNVVLCHDGNGAKVELLKIKPGGSAATHTHLGDEYTVILKGSFSDEQGLYTKGDFLMRSRSDHHTPVATRNSECICLTVTEGPVRLTGFFSRLLNPLIRSRYA